MDILIPRNRKRQTSMKRMMYFSFLLVLLNTSDQINHLEEQLVCSPNRMNGSCRWNLFGWKMYRGCGYRQTSNERSLID